MWKNTTVLRNWHNEIDRSQRFHPTTWNLPEYDDTPHGSLYMHDGQGCFECTGIVPAASFGRRKYLM